MDLKSLSLQIVLLLLTAYAKCQQLPDSPSIGNKAIVGVWQVNTDLVASAVKANFHFYKNGKFIYNTDGYDDLNPLVSISGVYKIDKNTLYLKIRSTKQLTGFKVIASEPAWMFGSFQVFGGKVVTIKQDDKDYSEHEIKVVIDKKAPRKKIIKIDSEKYYKISDDPDKLSE